MYRCLLCCEKDHSPWQSRRAQRVSFRTTVHRITKEWALVMVIFHPGPELGVIFFSGSITKKLFPWDCQSGKFSGKLESRSGFQKLFLGAVSVMSSLLRPKEHKVLPEDGWDVHLHNLPSSLRAQKHWVV